MTEREDGAHEANTPASRRGLLMTRFLGAAASPRGFGRAPAGGGIGALFGSAFGTLDVDAAKKKRGKKRTKKTCQRNCADRTCGNDGCGGSCGTCGTNHVCHGGTCCVPDSRGATCGGRCGTWTNNCGQPVACAMCAAGQQCLSNGSCAVVCDDNADCSGTGCNGCSNPSIEGARHCISGPFSPDVLCTTTLDCPPGSHCQDIGAASNFCIRLCK
jgi:hypothetical protein